MTKRKHEHVLVVRLYGPGTRDGRIFLSDLVRFGRQLQTSVDRVARVLTGEAISIRPGRKPKEISALCALKVVALEPGSVALVLDLPREQEIIEGLDLGEETLEKFFGGLESLIREDPALPAGYDPGVLQSWRETGKLFEHGIERVEFKLGTRRVKKTFSFDQQVCNKVIERIRKPIQNLRTVEGRLLMADFKEPSTKCRVDPPIGQSVPCTFDESLADLVKESLRSYVRVTGEAEEDPTTGRVKSLKISDIEPLEIEMESTSISADEFWYPKTFQELAEDQNIQPIQRLEDIYGHGSDLWESDEDFESFLSGGSVS